VYRHRQFPRYSDAELAELYAVPHDHTQWSDHVYRVQETIAFAKSRALFGRVADLSCGSAAIAQALSSEPILGDCAPGYDHHGPIERTIFDIPFVDVFVLTEVLEHLHDPEVVLRRVRNKTRQLLVSTPLLTSPDGNPQHYWNFDGEAVFEMLRDCGFDPYAYREIFSGMGYHYQLWACR
jgi:hypothetical protein